MTLTDDRLHWGTEIARRDDATPFLCYSPRRHHVAELLEDAARWHDRVHLVQGSRRLTFAQILAATDVVADELRAAGLRPGDRLLLLTPNSPEWVIAFWAAVRVGAIVALGNGWWSSSETAHATTLTAPRLVIADAKRGALLPEDLDPDRVVDVGTVREWVERAPAAPVRDAARTPETAPARASSEDDPAVIIFTAGTTGPPNAVTLAHRSVIANVHNLLAMSRRLPGHVDDARPPAVSLQSGPLFHIGGLQSLVLALLGGNTLIFLEGRFDGGQVLDIIEREQVTWWAAVPTMASRVLDHPTVPDRDLRSVRSVSMGGAPVQPALLERLRLAFPNAEKGMSTVYGMTETGGTLAAASGRTMAEHPTTAGRPLPVVELRIDAASEGEDGEIVVRTPGQMIGYWGREDGGAIDADGWVRTGDQGRLVDGLLYVTGRIKDIIIRGGENIAPSHIESVLLRHPAVANVAALGLPDDDLGERVGAVIQIRAGEHVSEAELEAFAAAELARIEMPAEWWLREEPLPMSDTGKVDKRSLRASWAGGVGARP
ncbi:MAG: AMP-binding enzyme family protein [Conexibacter sp.]|nr:AMP-binding enzyme family protein [Conexibacter sp.]